MRFAVVIALFLALWAGTIRADDRGQICPIVPAAPAAPAAYVPHMLGEPCSRLSGTDRQTQEARNACCSGHGGVCGCDASTNRDRCCDGVESKSCSC